MKYLGLNLDNNYIKENGIIAFSDTILELKQLKYLGINLINNNINDNGIIALSKAI